MFGAASHYRRSTAVSLTRVQSDTRREHECPRIVAVFRNSARTEPELLANSRLAFRTLEALMAQIWALLDPLSGMCRPIGRYWI